MALSEWLKLTCDCGSMEFVGTHELMWKKGQGVVPKQKGYMCAKCDKLVSTGALINKQQVIAAHKDLEEAQARIDNL